MALTAVTGLKITKITRRLGRMETVPSNLSGLPIADFIGSPASYPLESSLVTPAYLYTFDLEWVNPNFDPHWTELTITDSGVRKQLTNNHIQSTALAGLSLIKTDYALLTDAQIKDYIEKLYLGKVANTATTAFNHRLNYQSTAFTGGGQTNKFSTTCCQIAPIEGDAPRTVTITVTIKDITTSIPTSITKTISLSQTVSELLGSDTASLAANGQLAVKYLNPAVVTERDSSTVSATLLGVGDSMPASFIPHSIYSQNISSSDVRSAGNMQLGKFYKVKQVMNYGTAPTVLTTIPDPANWFYDLRTWLRETLYIFRYYSYNDDLGTVAFYLRINGSVGNNWVRILRATTLSGTVTSPLSRLYPLPSSHSSPIGVFTSSIDLQYNVVSPPSVETTATAVIRSTVGVPFTYVVKATTNGATSASSGATGFSLGALPAGITATIDSTGTITGTMTAAGTYTLSVTASNAAGTATGSVKFTCLAFVGNDTSIEISASQPIKIPLTASSNATFSILSTSSNVPSGSLFISNGVLSGVLNFVGSYTVTLRATSIGTTPIYTDDFTVSIAVTELAQPIGISVRSVRRVVSSDKRLVSYYGDVSWFNTESKTHTVKVERIDSETNEVLSTSFPYKSTSTGQILLGSWSADTAVDEKSFNINVTLVGEYSSSRAGIGSYSVSKSQTGSIVGRLTYDDAGNLNLPSFNLVESINEFSTTVGQVVITPDSTTPLVSPIAPSPSTWRLIDAIDAAQSIIPKTSLQFTTTQQVYGLKDGGKYFISVTYRLADRLSISVGVGNKNVWSTSTQEQTSSASIEYYYRGLTIPAITSSLAVKADVGATFQYEIEALGASSFAADFTNLSDFYINPSTGMIEGVFTTEEVRVIPISATNTKGTTTQNLTVTVRDFYADAKNLQFKVNKFIHQKLEASRLSSWVIVSGAPAGVSITVDSLGVYYLTGSVSATGSYSVLLRATQLNRTPVRTVDVVYTLNVMSSDFIDPSELPTTIITPSNLSLYQSEKPLLIGDRVKLAFKSDPSVASWVADGLPPGLKINAETGAVSGVVSTAGSYVAQITATAVGRATSLPLIAAFEVDPTTTDKLQAKAAGEAINRLPWLVSKWDLIDLQILARSRVVQSSLSATADDGATSLKFKIGDDLKFGVFFIDGDNMAFAISPSRVRLTIRPINNVDDPLILETVESPSVTIEEDTPYYELTSVRGVDWNAESMSIVEDWVLAQQAASSASAVSKLVAPLACVAEVEWIKEGKSYSSESFPVSLELDVNR